MIRVPGHVSTLFYPVYEGPKPIGSLGAGFSVSVGVFTEAVPSEAPRAFVNGIESDFVSATALRLAGLNAAVYHYTEAPLGFGFGLSAASALGAVLEAARILGVDEEPERLAHYAHEAEIIHKTGLGDVIAEFYGGFEIRKKAGSPLTGRLERIDPAGRSAALIVLGELETPRILADGSTMRRVIKAAEAALDSLRPDVRSIVEAGREFAEESGLLSLAGIETLYRALSEEYELVSMIMLSRGVFVLSRDRVELISLKERFGENARLADVADGRTFI